jgi:hypothetical protein
VGVRRPMPFSPETLTCFNTTTGWHCPATGQVLSVSRRSS